MQKVYIKYVKEVFYSCPTLINVRTGRILYCAKPDKVRYVLGKPNMDSVLEDFFESIPHIPILYSLRGVC